jgi:hypothetical protein
MPAMIRVFVDTSLSLSLEHLYNVTTYLCTLCPLHAQVLLLQSLPAVSRASACAKWWLVVAGQAGSVASSLLPALLPRPEVVTGCRAMHGAATAGKDRLDRHSSMVLPA